MATVSSLRCRHARLAKCPHVSEPQRRQLGLGGGEADLCD
jgi:hypothetical protein